MGWPKILNEERRRKIIEITYERKSAGINYPAELPDSSHSTIRRDPSILSKIQLLRKVYGRTVSPDSRISLKEGHTTPYPEEGMIRRIACSHTGDASILADTGTSNAPSKKKKL